MELQLGNSRWYWINEKRTREQGTVITYIDVTERKQAEEEFRHAQKMEAIGRLTAGVAHEFNNLLTAIGGFAHMLKRGTDNPETADDWLEDIIGAADQGAALTRQLLTFSHSQAPDPKVMPISTILAKTENLLRPTIGESIVANFEVSDGQALVEIDSDQLSQALVNLIINAKDAMPNGGNLTIACRTVELDDAATARFEAAKASCYVAISVTDTGTGIDEETKKKIFEPFFTTKEVGKGTGLGLAMVYGMVQQLGGVITVDSELGVGSTFTIYLPLADVAKAKAGDEVEDDLAALQAQGETVLIAEDELMVRQLARIALEGLGYTVLAAENGEKALEMYHKHDGPIHILVTDMKMPVMNGRQLARKLKAEDPGLKMLFITGYDINLDDDEGLEDTVMLHKPFDPNELGRIVREMLNDSRNASAA